ncbi:MAG: hypothetical protein KGK11_05920 [Sphingomonadales bacterium]|nr:hypothetical protein [Sphingomonadales bacterium]
MTSQPKPPRAPRPRTAPRRAAPPRNPSAATRCAISFFYDPQGILDDYMVYLLEGLRAHCTRIVFVVNGRLDEASRAKVAPLVDHLVLRENAGFDVWAYKAGLALIAETYPEGFDEVVMLNHTFYGPIFPFAEMFDAMARRECDFWGMTAHRQSADVTPDGPRDIPYHLNSHWIAVRRSLAESDEFKAYWREMRPIVSYEDSINHHEIQFTRHFTELGFTSAVYVDPASFGTDYPAFLELDECLRTARMPILKRRAFFHDPAYLDEHAVDLPRALALIETTSDYPTELIWRNIVRSTPARVLYTNAARLRVLPDEPAPRRKARGPAPRVAVAMHVFYPELVEEMLGFCDAIPVPYDIVATTQSAEIARAIKAQAKDRANVGQVIVRRWDGRGRDNAGLYALSADFFADDRYDLVCRIHSKKSPQVAASLGNYFKRHMLENLLGGRGYVERLIGLFADHPDLGVAMPPMIHLSTPTLGHAWFVNRERTLALAERLDIAVPIDGNSPIAVFGGMYWFRPKALRKLFKAGLVPEDFEPEPMALDGALGHAIERLVVYAAHDAGYSSMAVAMPRHAEQAYTMLEFKAEEMAGRLPTGDFRRQIDLLNNSRGALRAAMLGNNTGLDSAEAAARHHTLSRKLDRAEARYHHSETRLRKTAVPLAAHGIAGLFDIIGLPRWIRNEIATIARYMKALSAASHGRIACPGKRAIAHYVTGGYLEHRELFTMFDSSFYMASNTDILGSGINPLVHFIRHGWDEGRSPHPLIDIGYLRGRGCEDFRAGALPLAALAERRVDPALSLHPLFDSPFYLAQLPPGELGNLYPFEHYMREWPHGDFNPNPLFDDKFYKAHSPELVTFNLPPLVHYIRYGGHEGRAPSAGFDGKAYLDRYPDVRVAGFNPLEHFLSMGRHEGRWPK